VPVQNLGDTIEFANGKTIVLAQANRSCRAVQIKDRGRSRTDDVNVCWPVVVRVDDYSKIANSQDGRHRKRIAYS